MLTEFNGTLAHNLAFGHMLQVVAKTIDSASKCRISLMTSKYSKDPQSDVGLNFTVYFRDNVIGRNSRIHGIWGNEERHIEFSDVPPNPIESGEFFMIYIFCGSDRYHISINNQAFCTFNYRLPISVLRAIEIGEQIQAIKQVDHRIVFPSPWPPIQSSDYFKAFSSDTPILFSPGHKLSITARCFGNKNGQLIIKFMDSDTRRELLHFSVRFDQKVVARNSMNQAFEFGPEERNGIFPFEFNQQFQLDIAFTDREFMFIVDGKHFTNFAFRSHNILENLVGFKVTAINGLQVHVTSVDHKRPSDDK